MQNMPELENHKSAIDRKYLSALYDLKQSANVAILVNNIHLARPLQFIPVSILFILAFQGEFLDPVGTNI